MNYFIILPLAVSGGLPVTKHSTQLIKFYFYPHRSSFIDYGFVYFNILVVCFFFLRFRSRYFFSSNLCIVLFVEAHRALELLEDYHSRLAAPQDRTLRIAIERVIRIFKSRLFQALLGKYKHHISFEKLLSIFNLSALNTKWIRWNAKNHFDVTT